MSVTPTSIYPLGNRERDRWVVGRRPERNVLDPARPYAFFVENECTHRRDVVPVATILLTNRECPWRCLMCDLWKNTLNETVPQGAIPGQIEYAMSQLPQARQIKLYNSGSFFDLGAIPLIDYPAIASQTKAYERIIVESHPNLIGESCFRFRDMLDATLEVAMGLETANPVVLERLNKRITVDTFAEAARTLLSQDMDLRVFILTKLPFVSESESLHWAKKSLDFAFDCGATVATLIPTRRGNGALDELALSGDFGPPQLATLEDSVDYGIGLKRGRVFTDLWETDHLSGCSECREVRLNRLRIMNLRQVVLDPVSCTACGGGCR